MLDLRAAGDHKDVPIVRTIATRGLGEGSGIRDLAAAVEGHRQRAWTGDGAHARAVRRAAAQLGELVRGLLADRAARAIARAGGLSQLAEAVARHELDPYTAADKILS
jgi:putative protein kinase ArgK-like GTPase of G3E family